MHRIAAVTFWISFAIVVYSYVGYPLVLRFLSRRFAKPTARRDDLEPTVAVVVAAFNEENVIEEKIRNTLSLDYPADKLSLWVGSDRSTDRTEDLVGQCGDPRVHLWQSPRRMGKAGVLNHLVDRVGADIDVLVFTDADIELKGDSLRRLVPHYADPAVGGVGGSTYHRLTGETGREEHSYRSVEAKLKSMESCLHSTISAFGSFYSVRRKLFVPFAPNTYSNDDVMLPMNIVRQGYRMAFEVGAISYERTGYPLAREFRRRVRIGAGDFQAFFWLLDFLSPVRGWPWFCYVSHKVTRWFSPFLLGLSFVSALLGAWQHPLSASGAFVAASVLATSAALSSCIITNRWTKSLFYFLVMNLALVVGFLRFAGGIRSAVWTPMDREGAS